MKKILICPPTFFDIDYEINPWMHIEQKVDREGVAAAYEELKNAYRSLPVELYEMTPEKGLPDMVYMADCGHVVGDTFISASFRFPERRREAEVAQKWMQEQFNFEIKKLPDGIFFEGHGDLITAPDVYFCGYGKRTMKEALPYLEQWLNKPVIGIELIDPWYYHLDTCFAVLTKDVAVVNPTSFTPESKAKIYNHFKTVIEASIEDHKILGCNLVVVDKTIIVAKGISETLKNKFTDLGFTTREVDTTEYRKGGGSVKCLSFEFVTTQTPTTAKAVPSLTVTA